MLLINYFKGERTPFIKWTWITIYTHRVITFQKAPMESFMKPFKYLEQLLENSAKIQFSRVLIDQEESNINRKFFSINRIGKHQLSQAKPPGIFSSSLQLIEQKLRPIKKPESNFHFIHFTNKYFPNLSHYYNSYISHSLF